ncbi:MAG: KamA family radical SAM protein [Dehalococcoidia bacterium]|nr:KamA family radical SAM protein [Dehalococcoidia bacterium]
MTEPASTARDQAVEEPPGADTQLIEIEKEEPPSSTARSNRARFFGAVPEGSWNDWRWQFRNRINSIEDLARFVPLSPREKERLKLVAASYPMSITPHYLSLIAQDDPTDPLRKQAIPCFKEIGLAGMGEEDPLEERSHAPVPGLVHRYPDRVLMVLTNVCPMLCRHCTRKREWRHGWWVRTESEIEEMLAYIGRNGNIRDVIISGGDPLTLSTRRLEVVIRGLRQIKHVEVIRIGSRFPVVLPQRIDDELCSMLGKYGPIWLNTQFNHIREITPEAALACDRLLCNGVPVSNQSVLLKGINDTVEAQTRLCHGLLRIKVRPYYLYECDEVQGTEHLRTSVETGLMIMEGMRGHTSGLAIPTFVVDLPRNGGKVPLQPAYVLVEQEDHLVLRNYEGRIFHYRNPKPVNAPANGSRKVKKANGRPQQPASGGQYMLPIGA